MKSRFLVLAALLPALHASAQLATAASPSKMEHSSKPQMQDVPVLPKPGTKIPLQDGGSFVYTFDKTPKMGTSILKVEIYDASGKKDTSCQVTGDVDMPSMRGHHSSGQQQFKLSKKGDYLLPVTVVMPGEWEVSFTVSRGGKVVLRGRHLFPV